VRALALLHVLAEHSVVLLALRGLDLAAATAGSSGGDSAEAAASRSFLTSLAAQPLLTGDVGVDAFFTLSGCAGAAFLKKRVVRCW
jgi:peptidoglycan/LPS O-acetylase OafA/YrhL